MKKRIAALILGVLLIISLTACNISEQSHTHSESETEKSDSEVKTVRLVYGEGYKEEYDDATYNTVIKASCPAVMLYYGDENNYPKLNEALADIYKTGSAEIPLYFEENRAYAKEMHDEYKENFLPFELSTTATVRRADSIVTSLLFTRLEYSGGANGNYFQYGENYNTKEGTMIGLYDVLADEKLLYDAITDQLDLFYSSVWSGEASDVESIIKDGSRFSWTLDYNGITFYFMPYSLITTAPGTQTVTLSNEEYPGLLKEKFTAAPDAYGVGLANDTAFYYDVTGDGKLDEIIFSAYTSNDGDLGCVSIYINGKPFDTEGYFYDAKPVFVHSTSGKNYILVEVLTDNDHMQLQTFSVSDVAEYIGNCDAGFRKVYHEGGELLVTRDLLTNPENFCLQTTTQHLSTVSGYKKYSIGNNGLPASDEEYFMFDEEKAPTFRLLQDIETESYDEEKGTVNGKVILKKGSEVVYIGTDGERYALLSSESGVCRIETEADTDGPFYKINGISVDEVFDGIVYAG